MKRHLEMQERAAVEKTNEMQRNKNKGEHLCFYFFAIWFCHEKIALNISRMTSTQMLINYYLPVDEKKRNL